MTEKDVATGLTRALAGAGEVVCQAVDLAVKSVGGSQTESDAALLLLAKHVKMKPKGLAAEYLMHFLRGTGEPKTFDTKRLLDEDSGVRSRLEMEILRKISDVKVKSEKRTSYDPCITIFQSNFSNRDWQYALGTFNFDWQQILCTEDHYYVRISGQNEYTWHPEALRITQCVHRAGARLNGVGAGKNFSIHATPLTLVFSEVRRQMVEWVATATQQAFKPREAKGSY